MSRKGMTLLEVIVASALMMGVIVGGVSYLFQVTRSQRVISSIGSFETDLMTATKLVRRVGRMATECKKIVGGLECKVPFDHPPNPANLKTVQIVLESAPANPPSLVYYVDGAEKNRFSNISQFTTCDSADYAANTCNLCNSGDVNVACASVTKSMSVLAGKSSEKDNVFRYQLGGISPKGSKVSYVSGFFARNAAPINPALLYEW